MNELLTWRRYFKGLKYLLLATMISLIIILIYFYFNKDEFVCPGEYIRKDIHAVSFSGIVLGKSINCEKNILEIFFKSNIEYQYIGLPIEYACLLNEVNVKDSIFKPSKSYVIKIIKNRQEKMFSYECTYSCSCESKTLLPNNDFIYYDIINGQKFNRPKSLLGRTLLE